MTRALRRGLNIRMGWGARAWTIRVLVLGLSLGAIVAAGCGGDGEDAGKTAPLRVFTPWPFELRMRRVFERYQIAHPGVRFELEVGTPGTLIKRARQGDVPDVLIAMGPVETDTLRGDRLIRDGGESEIMKQHIILACSPAMKDVVKELKDVAKPEVRKAGLCVTPILSVGVFTRRALEKTGVLKAAKAKGRTPPLTSLVEGKVDCAIALEEFCYLESLFDGKRVPLPGVIVVGELPESLCPELSVSALALKGPARPELAIGFVQFLGGRESREIFQRRGPTACPT